MMKSERSGIIAPNKWHGQSERATEQAENL